MPLESRFRFKDSGELAQICQDNIRCGCAVLCFCVAEGTGIACEKSGVAAETCRGGYVIGAIVTHGQYGGGRDAMVGG